MLHFTDKWLQWSQMKAKVSKCQAMAIEGSTGRLYDPKLYIAGGEIPFVNNNLVRFLGGTIQVPRDQTSAREAVEGKLTQLLQQVDAILATRKQKLKLVRVGVCPRLS
jgi:hypothetical protein